MSVELLAAVAAVVLGPVVAYVTTTRKLSGKIRTTDADQLWVESRSIRDDYRDRLARAEHRVMEVETRMAEVERRNGQLERENVELTAKVRDLQQELHDGQVIG